MEWNILGLICSRVKIFTLERAIIRIMVGAKPTILHRNLFKRYIFYLFHANIYIH
jgi:hypothetical protein